MTRQLATLLHAGMPLVRGLEVLARQGRNPAIHDLLRGLATELRAGGTLSATMAKQPRSFDRLYVSMVRAGEAGGVLGVVLERLARFEEKSLRLGGRIRAAMVYPVVVLTVAASILAGLLIIVVPKFQQIFSDLLRGAPLPPLTQAVVRLSEILQHHWIAALGGTVAAGLALKFLRNTAGGARLTDRLLVTAPPFGNLFLKAVIARFSRTLGTLLSSGVPILAALTITRDTCGNAHVARAIETLHDRVKGGSSVARPLESGGVFPPMVTGLIDVGEQTGQLPAMLGRIADIYEDEVDTAVDGLSSIIEPVLIVFLAVGVGTIVIALFLPIIRIVQVLM